MRLVVTSDRLAWKRGAVVDSEEFDSYIQVVRLVAGGHLVPLQKASAGSHISRDEPAEVLQEGPGPSQEETERKRAHVSPGVPPATESDRPWPSWSS